MMKFTAILVLMVIGTIMAAGPSCNSCGRECVTACGTRHFRSCCFNYLRKKRGPDMLQILLKDEQDIPVESTKLSDVPYVINEASPIRAASPYYLGH